MHPITWDIDRVFVYVPFFDFPIYWYGLFFALGIYLSQKWLLNLMEKEGILKKHHAQNFIVFLVISIVCGARIFDILFYQDLQLFIKQPIEILNLRAGGLSSHGGFLGFLFGLIYQTRKLKMPFFQTLALISAPTGLLAFFIRIGNLFNQEILGKPYFGPFSFIFKNPLEQAEIIPRHPIVLYEALTYLCIALILSRLKVRHRQKVGLALVLYFGSRIFLEPMKLEQSVHQLPYGMTMGMILSIPIVLVGIYLSFSRSMSKISHARDFN